MESGQTIASSISALSRPAGIFDVSKKVAIIRLRWPVVIICSYLLLYSRGGWVDPVMVHGFLLFYILSNAALYLVDEKLFGSSSFYGPLVIFDTFFLSASLTFSGEISTEFYIAYFLTIILCGICKDFRGLMVIALLGPVVYGYFLFRSAEVYDPSLYLRLPFPFVISLFYGYFAQIEHAEKGLRERAEQEAQNRENEERLARILEQGKNQAEELDKANKVRAEFLSVMSHELRTPLNVVMGYTGMIQDKMLGEINPEQEEALGKVMRRSGDLLAMITSILQATTLEAQGVTVESHEVHLGEFLEYLKSFYTDPLENKEIALIWDYPSDLPVIRTDNEKLRYILQNLINNAIKFTKQGNVTLSARYFSETKTVEFKVTDTGIGIPQEALSVIFEQFRQVDSSETRLYGGVGLGLHVAKRFTEMLGGRIEVESEPDKGSTFTVTLPA